MRIRPGTMYYLGLIRGEFFFRGCRTLKDRRSHVLSIRDRLKNMGFSVAQTGRTDIPQRAWLAAVFVSGSKSVVRQRIDRAEELFYGPEWELASLRKDILGSGEELPEWEVI